MTRKESRQLERAVQIHKALSHSARIRALATLRDGELCACQITAVLDLAPSTVSAHLAELRRAGLVSERKEGRWVIYAVNEDDETLPVLEPLWKMLAKDSLLREDRILVRKLRSVGVEELCRVDLDLTQLAISRTSG